MIMNFKDKIWSFVLNSVQVSTSYSIWRSVRNSVRDSVQDSVRFPVWDSVRDSTNSKLYEYEFK